MRWVGIDEAGYGPNLGPLVMTAVVAEGPDDRPPRLWDDLAATVCRAGDAKTSRLWVDDSKAVFKGRKGRDRLDAATLAVLDAIARPPVTTLGGLGSCLAAGSLDMVELSMILPPGADPKYPPLLSRSACEVAVGRRPFAGATWRLVDARAEVFGPSRFNAALDVAPDGSKASVHFAIFAALVRYAWASARPSEPVFLRGDKHGGRHFYAEPLRRAFPEATVEAGPEGPDLSAYTLTAPGRSPLTIHLVPRADADDGLVALASIIAKGFREHWMDAFNAHWIAQVPGLAPTAGYPVDARRFRRAIEPLAEAQGLTLAAYWRAK